jgi:hypothetical protein
MLYLSGTKPLVSLQGIVLLLVFSTANSHHEPEAELSKLCAIVVRIAQLSNPALLDPSHRSWISQGPSGLGSREQVHVGSMLKVAMHVEMIHEIS